MTRLEEVASEEECLAFARQAVAEFPSDEKLQRALAIYLIAYADSGENHDKAMFDEAEKNTSDYS